MSQIFDFSLHFSFSFKWPHPRQWQLPTAAFAKFKNVDCSVTPAKFDVVTEEQNANSRPSMAD